jgi:hypothetical protein
MSNFFSQISFKNIHVLHLENIPVAR